MKQREKTEREDRERKQRQREIFLNFNSSMPGESFCSLFYSRFFSFFLACFLCISKMKRIIEIEKIRITEIIEDGNTSDENVVKRTIEGLDELINQVTCKVRGQVVEIPLNKQDDELSSAPLGLVVPTQPNTWCPFVRHLDQSPAITRLSLTAWNGLRMAYIKSGFIYCITSTDGETWNFNTPTATGLAAECLSITPFLSKLWMVFAAPGGGTIYVYNSVDGTTWPVAQSRVLNGTSANCLSVCTFSVTNILYIAYVDQSTSSIKILYSDATGSTWFVFSFTSGTAVKYVSIAQFNSSLFLAFVDTSGNLWISSSTNPINGTNWSSPIQLGANSSDPSVWNANTCNIVSFNSFLYLSWASGVNDNMYLASTGTTVQASNGSSWSNASQIQSWTGSYVALVPYTPPAMGFNLFLGYLEPSNGVYNGISCTGYNLVSYTSTQVSSTLRTTFQNQTIPLVYNQGNSNPAYLPLNYSILKKVWDQDQNLQKNLYVNDNFNCNDYANCMKALVSEYSYGLLTFYDYNGNENASNASDFLWTGKAGLCGRVQVRAQTGSGGHSFNCTIDPAGTVVCFEPEGGYPMTVNSNGTVTGQNGAVWVVVMVIF